MEALIKELLSLNCLSVAVRIFLAALLGGCIGSERGHHGQPAGPRTHILVCVGAALTTLIGMYAANLPGFAGDPMRVGAQVISGIGFLGAGTIMVRKHSQVVGLTTAAGLWTTACIGLALGAGFYWPGIVAFLVVIVCNTLLSQWARRIRKVSGIAYYVELDQIDRARDVYQEIKPWVSDVEVVPAKSGIPAHLGLEIQSITPQVGDRLFECLKDRDNVVIMLPLYH